VSSQTNRLLEHLRRLAAKAEGEPRGDGQLLEHFIHRRDEAAFAALLRRHGPMVRGVCRRILGNVHDADDAFQATFLVLVRKAESIRPREAVGNWLYGVAYRTALEARRRLTRRHARETALHPALPASQPVESLSELGALLDRELSRLGDKYRLPIILCDLEGRSRKEVARHLAIPEGTLSSRLATGRKKLAARLTRLGFAVTAASLAELLAESTAAASVPLSLLNATTQAALLTAAGPAAVSGCISATVSTLTEGVMKAMFIAKIKTATLVLCGVAALGLGTGGVYYQTRAGAADVPARVSRDEQGQQPRAARAAQQDVEKWRDIAKEAQEREQKLRAEVEGLRAKLEKLQDVVKQQEAKMRSELEARERELKEAALRETELRQQRQLPRVGRPFPPAGQPVSSKDPQLQQEVLALQLKQDLLTKNYHVQREDLRMQLKKVETALRELDEKFQKDSQALEHLRLELQHRQSGAMQGRQTAAKPKGGTDKLDQILERLERLEKRLDRLERGKR
jgi:RNA polymerase sigma factor (sigma-70 family)